MSFFNVYKILIDIYFHFEIFLNIFNLIVDVQIKLTMHTLYIAIEM